MTLLQASHIQLSRQSRRVLHDVSLALGAGEVLGIVGPNGAGKSSLIAVLAGLLKPDRGLVQLAGRPVCDWLPQERAERIAWLAQGREVHWPLPVRDLVALGRHAHADLFGTLAPDQWARCEDAMQRTGVCAFAERSCLELSGGELARVLLARALAVEADILLADEPVAGLDPFHQLSVMQILRAEAARQRAVLVVLHDLNLAARFCDRLLLLDQGRILAEGNPAQVLTPDNLAQSFHIRVRIQNDDDGLQITPLACSRSP